MFSKKLLVFVMATILCISMWQVLSAQTLQEILDKHAEALGGKEALKALGNSVTVFNITVPGGMTGTQKSYFKYPNKIKDEVDLGIFTSLTVFDGQKGWTKDPNGQVRELAGQELEGIRTNLYFSCYAYLFQERGKGEVEYLGREEAGGINYHIIQVTPEDCEPVKLYINPETFLVDRTVSKQDVVVNTSFLSDYQVFEGIKIATSSRLNRGDTTYDIRSKLVSVEFNPPLSDELFSIPQAAGKDYKFPGGKDFVVLPFVLSSNHIFIPVVIGGSRPLNLALDSGAGMPCLNLKTSQELGLKLVGKLQAGGVGEERQEMNFVTLSSIKLGDLVIDSISAITIDLEPLHKYEGLAIEGIVGYDIFSRFVVKIDYSNHELTLYEPSSFRYEGKGEAIPITLENNHPHIRAVVDGEYEGNFVIDCGSRGSLALHSPFVKKYDLEAKTGKKIEMFTGIGIGGKAMGKATRVKSLQIGSFEIASPLTNLSSAEAGAFSSEKTDGNIGGGILKRFTVIFDYTNSRMILEPNANFAYEDNIDMTGLWLTQENDTTKVDFVIEDSPAGKAGIKEGDVLLSINGKSSGELSLEDIRSLLMSGAGKTVELKIFSKGKEKSLNLTLEKLI